MFIYFNLCLSIKLDSLSCSFTNITLKTQIRLESKDIDVNEHERLSNFILRHKLK
jgi:hypothetical protein